MGAGVLEERSVELLDIGQLVGRYVRGTVVGAVVHVRDAAEIDAARVLREHDHAPLGRRGDITPTAAKSPIPIEFRSSIKTIQSNQLSSRLGQPRDPVFLCKIDDSWIIRLDFCGNSGRIREIIVDVSGRKLDTILRRRVYVDQGSPY